VWKRGRGVSRQNPHDRQCQFFPVVAHAKTDFAIIRGLRDIGGGDYVAARLAPRHRFVPQFLWSAEQALEKYLKGILTLDRVSALTMGTTYRKL
jgi:hypothetical protein